MINSVNVTEACAKALVILASKPCELTDFDARVPRTLAKNDLAEIDEAKGQVRISSKGLELLRAMKAKSGNGEAAPVQNSTQQSATKKTKARKLKGKRRGPSLNSTKPTKRDPPPPTGKVVNLDQLREYVEREYRDGLALIEWLCGVAGEMSA
jgi:hypothetical protein